MFLWAQVSKLQFNEPFLSFRKSYEDLFCLKYCTVMKEIRLVLQRLKQQEFLLKVFNCKVRRWKSTSMPMHYSKSNRESFNLVR
jgi:hypothetical protein